MAARREKKKPRAPTKKEIDRALAIVGKGNFRSTARARMKVPELTWTRWIRTGKKELAELENRERSDLTNYGKLVQELEAMEAETHDTMLQDVLKKGVDAKRWFMQKRWAKLYAQDPKHVIDDESGERRERDMREILIEKLEGLIDGQS